MPACSIMGGSKQVADTKATAKITRHICPPTPPLPAETEQALDKALTSCLALQGPHPFTAFICDKYIYVLSAWEVARDQARACYAQK